MTDEGKEKKKNGSRGNLEFSTSTCDLLYINIEPFPNKSKYILFNIIYTFRRPFSGSSLNFNYFLIKSRFKSKVTSKSPFEIKTCDETLTAPHNGRKCRRL